MRSRSSLATPRQIAETPEPVALHALMHALELATKDTGAAHPDLDGDETPYWVTSAGLGRRSALWPFPVWWTPEMRGYCPSSQVSTKRSKAKLPQQLQAVRLLARSAAGTPGAQRRGAPRPAGVGQGRQHVAAQPLEDRAVSEEA